MKITINKKVILITSTFIIVILLVVAVSYALLKENIFDKSGNIIYQSGDLDITLTEDSSSGITLTSLQPVTDTQGMAQTAAYKFTVANKGSKSLHYEVYLDRDTAAQSSCTNNKGSPCEFLTETQLRYQLKTNGTSYVTTLPTSRRIYTGDIAANTTDSQELRLWISYLADNYAQGKYYFGKLRIEVTQNLATKMKSYSSSSTDDYHHADYKTKITSVTTTTSNMVPTTALKSWDVSAAKDKSVMAYIESDGTAAGTYKLTLGAAGKILVNSTSFLFSGFTALKSADLSHVNTSSALSMTLMFSGCKNLTNLNLSELDTSNVSTMKSMFENCSSLRVLDLSSFDTSKVTDMSSMFRNCSSLTSLNLNNFYTSRSTDMAYMFSGCTNLTSLLIESFDTSYVTDMSYMFSDCKNLVNLDLSNFDTSKVLNMRNMFENCSSLTDLNLGNFNTSKVTEMASMFSGCTNLVRLNVSSFDTSKVTDMYAMFATCSHLTMITLGVGWTNILGDIFSNWTSSQTIRVAGTCASKNYESGWSGQAIVIWLDEPNGC